jgi:hypothetical protein
MATITTKRRRAFVMVEFDERSFPLNAGDIDEQLDREGFYNARGIAALFPRLLGQDNFIEDVTDVKVLMLEDIM